MLLCVIQKKLKAAVGRPWNDVFSEIRAQLPARMKHWAEDMVDVHQIYTYWYRDKLYVDEKGILRKYEHKKHKRKPRPITFLWLDKELHYLDKGLWYKLIFDFWDDVWAKSGKTDHGYRTLNDVIYGSWFSRNEAIRSWGRKEHPLICIGKRACNTKASKKLNSLKAELEASVGQ